MANIKISELNELYEAQRDYNDYVPVVDTSADETKKISVKNLIRSNVQLIAVTDTEPAEYETGDKYYNTTDNRIYTATSSGWANAETPIRNIFYVVISDKTTYTYDDDNETLISVGGGGGSSVVIGDESETTEDTKLLVDTSGSTDELKYKDETTGTFKDLEVKALDSLPVGAEIDFDGSVSDIPIGWEQVDNILWENTNPTSNFAGQTINLETNSYTEYNVYYKINNSLDYVRIERVVVGTLGIIVFPTTTGFTSNNSARWLTAISNQSITFGDATTGGTTSNNLLVPIKVVGIK